MYMLLTRQHPSSSLWLSPPQQLVISGSASKDIATFHTGSDLTRLSVTINASSLSDYIHSVQ